MGLFNRAARHHTAMTGYHWALLGIFFYHSLQVFFLPFYDDCVGNTMGNSFYGPSRLLSLASSPLPEQTGVRKALSEFVPSDYAAQRQRPDHTCTRWNTTYVFPQAPSFISKKDLPSFVQSSFRYIS
jgi:hypothetical protein